MLRTFYPQMVASKLVGGQPMNIESRRRLQSRDETGNMYPYIAQRHDSLWDLGFRRQDLEDMKEYCHNTFNSNSWHYVNGNFHFRNAADRTIFLLRWL